MSTPEPTPALRIRARREGFRRAGVAHSREWVTHPAGTFTPDQVAALEEEAMLEVHTVPSAASGEGDAPAPAGAATAAGPVASPNAGDPEKGVAGTNAEGEGGDSAPAAAAVAGPDVGAGAQPAEAGPAATTPAAGATAAPVVPPTRKGGKAPANASKDA